MLNTISIPILGLDDDIHDICYVTQGGYWHNAQHLMEDLLCKPHTVEYKIKVIHFIDIDDNFKWQGYDGWYMEDILSTNPEYQKRNEKYWKTRQEIFEYLWNADEKELYGYE